MGAHRYVRGQNRKLGGVLLKKSTVRPQVTLKKRQPWGAISGSAPAVGAAGDGGICLQWGIWR